MLEVVLVAAAAILVGSVLQRLSGTGVGLVVAPVLAILLGPAVGVLTTNATTTVSGFLIMLAVRRDVDWRRYGLIAGTAVLGSLPAAWLVATLPAPVLQVILGAVVLGALATTFGLPQLPRWSGPLPTVLAGAVGGFFNTTAGVAAPVMVIYAKLSQWEQRRAPSRSLSFVAVDATLKTRGEMGRESLVTPSFLEASGEVQNRRCGKF